MINKWQAHSNIINKLQKLEIPSCIISCSFDKHCKIFGKNG